MLWKSQDFLGNERLEGQEIPEEEALCQETISPGLFKPFSDS